MKKICLFIALLLCTALLCVPAFGAGETVAYPVEGGNIYFDRDNGLITGCDQSVTSASIPAEIDGTAVVGIGDRAFFSCHELTELKLPEGLKSIGNMGVASCSALKNVSLPKSLERIGDEAFYACESIKYLDVPSTVTEVGKGAFGACYKLERFVFPVGTTVIKDDTFFNCHAMKSVDIPASVTEIGMYAFMNCVTLRDIRLPQSLETIAYGAFNSCSAIPELVIPAKVREIGTYAFMHCLELKKVYLPESLEIIGEGAFMFCTALKEVDYYGGEKAWGKVDIMPENQCLLDASLRFLGVDKSIGFTDVFPADWYHDTIIAAAEAEIIAGNADGSFAPKGELTWAQTLVFATRLDQYRNGEKIYGPEDQTELWYSIYLDYCLEQGVIDATPENMGATITRGEAAVIFAAVLGDGERINTLEDGYFSDVAGEGPVHDAVYALAEAGICNGMGDGSFGVDGVFLRSQVSTIVARMAGLVAPVVIG